MKQVVIIVSTAVLTLVISSALLLFLPGSALGRVEASATEPPAEETQAPIYSYAIPDSIVTNMKDSKRYVKASIVLGLNKEEDITTLETYDYIVKDAVLRVLRDTGEAEYLDSQCQEKLGGKIRDELMQVLDIDGISEVYFLELVIQ